LLKVRVESGEDIPIPAKFVPRVRPLYALDFPCGRPDGSGVAGLRALLVEVKSDGGSKRGIPDGTRGIVGWRPPMKHGDFTYSVEWPVMFKLDVSAHDSFNMGIHTRAVRKDQLVIIELDGKNTIATPALEWLATNDIHLHCGSCGAEITQEVAGDHSCTADAQAVERIQKKMLEQAALLGK
jgi:hypothetical protein